jgi:hypothetical protein
MGMTVYQELLCFHGLILFVRSAAKGGHKSVTLNGVAILPFYGAGCNIFSCNGELVDTPTCSWHNQTNLQ